MFPQKSKLWQSTRTLSSHNLWDTIFPLWLDTCVLEVSGMVCLYRIGLIVSWTMWDYILVFSALYYFLSYYLSYNLHKKSSICTNKYLLIILAIKVIMAKIVLNILQIKLIYLLGKGGKTQFQRYIPKKNVRSNKKKLIIDLTLSIRVWLLLFVTPFCNKIPDALDWGIVSCSLKKESNLLNINSPFQSNQNTLIYLPLIPL